MEVNISWNMISDPSHEQLRLDRQRRKPVNDRCAALGWALTVEGERSVDKHSGKVRHLVLTEPLIALRVFEILTPANHPLALAIHDSYLSPDSLEHSNPFCPQRIQTRRCSQNCGPDTLYGVIGSNAKPGLQPGPHVCSLSVA